MTTTYIKKLIGVVMVASVIGTSGASYDMHQVFGVQIPQTKSVVVNNVKHGYVENSLQDTFRPHMQDTDNKINIAKLNNKPKNYTDLLFDVDIYSMHNINHIL